MESAGGDVDGASADWTRDMQGWHVATMRGTGDMQMSQVASMRRVFDDSNIGRTKVSMGREYKRQLDLPHSHSCV